VLDLIERGLAPQIEIAQPIDANKSISRDQTYDWIIELSDGRKISAIQVQRIYLAAVQNAVSQGDEDVRWILREWENVLNDLERDVLLCRDRVDWVAKKELLETLRNGEKLSWNDPWLQAIDLEYHNIVPESGLYYELVRQGTMRRFVSEAQIKEAIFSPPTDTRAYFRGRSVARFNSQIKSIQWDEIVFGDGALSQRVQLAQPNDNPRLAALNTAAREAADYPEFIRTVATL
jgi:proteasome accessory factor A